MLNRESTPGPTASSTKLTCLSLVVGSGGMIECRVAGLSVGQSSALTVILFLTLFVLFYKYKHTSKLVYKMV